MWNDVVYQPGELRVVAYDDCGKEVGEKVVKTAGKPHHLEISAGLGFIGKDEIPVLKADGKDLAYFTVKVVDKDGNLHEGFGPDGAKPDILYNLPFKLPAQMILYG